MPQLCNLCPRKCNVDRTKDVGFCKSADTVRVARVGLHKWEEPCICYGNGSGTIFFSGCNMKCVYCQNNEISSYNRGKDISVETLCYEMLRLCDMGACNINLVTPTHFADKIAKALERVKGKIEIPVVYNSSGYERVETLTMFDGLVDIYLPDLKYYSSEASAKYSSCPDYFSVASQAISKMVQSTGKCRFTPDGKLLSGTLVRHLVLPSLYRDGILAFESLAKIINPGDVAVSVMSQYFPSHKASEYREINRRITTLEYMKVVECVRNLGFCRGFMQERTSATQEYVPIFDYK